MHFRKAYLLQFQVRYSLLPLCKYSSSLRPGFYFGLRPPAEFQAIQSQSNNMAADFRLECSRFRGS